jgi:RNA polymerase sigma-70 factor (ECF subfamily)
MRADLFARALRFCRNRDDAEDLVQETTLRALRFGASYEAGSNARAWLFRIMFSVFVSDCRRRRRQQRAFDALRDDPNAWLKPVTEPAFTALLPPLEGALSGLPPSFAAVIELVDLEQLSYREAAQRLNVPVGTVMSRLHRGRRALAAVVAQPAQAA